MIPRLLTIWQNVRSSLWATPLAMICAAAALALIATNIRIGQGGDPVWFLYSGDAGDAPTFLSHLVTAMITMTTLAISITMVVLTLAAQQLGSRLIQSFMRDWHTQVTIGLLISTVIYLLLVLRNTYGIQHGAPNLAVTLGTTLVVVSVVVLLMFVHHLAVSIIADRVIQNVGSLLDDEICRLLPEKSDADDNPQPRSLHRSGLALKATKSGYVQAIDFDALMKIARAASVTVEWDVRAGHHVIAGSVIGWVEPQAAATEDVLRRIEPCAIVGAGRNPVQDLEFSIRHLVEIAVRALSTGINDPYTAISVIDRLAVSIARVMERGPARGIWRDDDGVVRIVAPVSTFEGIVGAAFNQIRQRAEGSADVLIRLAEKLGELIELADPQEKRVLTRHIELVLQAGCRSIEDEADLDVLKARAAPYAAAPAGASDRRHGTPG